MGEWGEANLMQIRLMIDNIVHRLKEFIENEARSCSMDFGCVTPEYVFRSWGGSIAMDEIATGLTELRKQGVFMVHGS